MIHQAHLQELARRLAARYLAARVVDRYESPKPQETQNDKL